MTANGQTKITRRVLYDLVWSKPITTLAAEFGISDVGLAKICERHRITTPGRGYWAKIAAGKPAKRVRFTPALDKEINEVVINPSASTLPDEVQELVRQQKEAKGEREANRRRTYEPPAAAVSPVSGPSKEHSNLPPAIRTTAKALRRSPDKDGTISATGTGLCGITVGKASAERAIAVLDGLARALEERGGRLEPKNNGMECLVGDGPDRIGFTLTEVTRKVKHEPTEAELAEEDRRRRKRERDRSWQGVELWGYERSYPEYDIVRTGELVIEAAGYGDGLRRRWADGKRQSLEAILPAIADGLMLHVATKRARREESERRARLWAEHARRMALADARVKREADRHAFVDGLVSKRAEAERLREAVEKLERAPEPRPGFEAMVQWMRDRLVKLEREVSADAVERIIEELNLFPDPKDDPLSDPLGEPERLREWQFPYR